MDPELKVNTVFISAGANSVLNAAHHNMHLGITLFVSANLVHVASVQHSRILFPLHAHSDRVNTARWIFSPSKPNRAAIASVSVDRSIAVWRCEGEPFEPRSWSSSTRANAHTTTINYMATLEDKHGTTIVTACADG